MQYDEQELSRAKPDHAHRFLRAHHGQRLFCQRVPGHHLLFRHVFPQGARQRRLRHYGRRGAAGGVPAEPDLHRGGHPVPPLQTYLQREILGIPAGFYILLRRVGHSRGHAHLPRGAHCHRARAGHPGPVCGNHGAAVRQPPEPYRNQGQPHFPGRPGPGCDGVRLPPGPGL